MHFDIYKTFIRFKKFIINILRKKLIFILLYILILLLHIFKIFFLSL